MFKNIENIFKISKQIENIPRVPGEMKTHEKPYKAKQHMEQHRKNIKKHIKTKQIMKHIKKTIMEQ